MPKEQPCLSERGPSAPSSKKAKETSGSIFQTDLHDGKDGGDSNKRSSSCSSEKDSGFSDGSDWQQTDVEDLRKNKNHPRPKEPTEISHPGQNKEAGLQSAGKPAMVSPKLAKRPVKDLVLKQQPTTNQKRGHLLWRNGFTVSNSSRSSHVILFEQPSFLPAHLQLHQPLLQRSNATGKKPNSIYLPILNSYPRIAPHPSNKPPDKHSLNQDSQNLSKRVCTEKNAETPPFGGLQEPHLHKHAKLAVSNSGQLCSSSTTHYVSTSTPTTASTSLGSPSTPAPRTTSTFSPPSGLHRNITTSARHRRFFNTVQILRQSGLLDITLRTKELLRQSNATQQDISQLQQHTELMCQAVSKPNLSLNGITAWEHLHRVMAESGSYPNLKVQQISQRPLHLECIPTGDLNRPQAVESSQVLPSCLRATLPQQSDSEESKRLEASDKPSDKVTFMFPDSSTG